MRLKEIFEFVDETDIFADIGCDHGLLCKMVFDAQKAKRILATDISPLCLNKAKALLGDNAEYYLGDGLKALGSIIPDETVISGMGGNTILDIMKGYVLPKVIISPQNDVYKVRDALNKCGYKIIADKLIVDDGRFYDIIKLVPGQQELSELQKHFGAFFTDGDRIIKSKLNICKQKLLSYKQTPENLNKLKLISEAEQWLR